jgi:hypothetical protein
MVSDWERARTFKDFWPLTPEGRVARAAPVDLRPRDLRLSDVNPVDYLAATLRAILDGHSQSGIEDLMPWRFSQPSSLAA